ncbi:acetyl-CoA decarbonylase/synthase complex subunit gamma [Methanophagales archaeon]|nr:acetyl-CoA decarbonylase/synthase complex subunit gamma [Methanophagales archaeon]
MKLSSPMDAWKYLPGTNCKECGEKTCLAFASLLLERQKKLEDCTPLLEPKYAAKAKELAELLAPEIREVAIGVGARASKIGGEDIMHRHELTFYDRTSLAYDVWDTMSEQDLRERVKKITKWRKFYVGEFLTLDAIAVRSVSCEAETFAGCVKCVAEETDMPLILCSFDANVLEAGLKEVSDRNPLLYAADKTNWQAILELAKQYNVPVTLSSPDLDTLNSLATTFAAAGIADLVLDPWTYPTGKGLADTFSRFVRIRRAGIVDGNKGIAYPLMGVPMTAWMANDNQDALAASYWEAIIADTLILRYADILILHSIEPHSQITERTLVANIYTDPRRPVSVDPGLREVGSPTDSAPIFVTTNFALTYYTVESDLSSNKIDCYLMVVDSDGLGVEAAVAGGQLTADMIKDTVASYDAEKKVAHKTMVLPGLAARISGETEDATGWSVLVGPRDSGRIPGWMTDNWPPKTSS